MNNENYLFSSSLTDGSRFRKFHSNIFLIGLAFYAVFFFISLFDNDSNIAFFQRSSTPFYIGVLALATLFLILSFDFRKKESLGNMKVLEDKIEIHKNGKQVFNFNDLENFEIQRGSTYHYSDEIDNELVKVSNFIRFKKDGIPHEYEFTIDSKQKNSMFESMIYHLQKNRVKLYYTSI